MINVYRLLYWPLYALYWVIRRRRVRGRPQVVEQSKQLRGWYKHLTAKKDRGRVWVHAVSVGEVKLALELVRRWTIHSEVEFFISVSTTTAYLLLEKSLQNQPCEAVVFGFFPLDSRYYSARAWGAIDPDLMVLIESELWPEHLHQARLRKVPVWLLNARLSERSCARLQRFAWCARWLYGHLSGVVASCRQTERQLAQLLQGRDVPVLWGGQLKCDVPPGKRLQVEAKTKVLLDLGLAASSETVVCIGVSTWPGEERLLVKVHKKLINAGMDAVLVLVPRHPERAPDIEQELSEELGHGNWLRRTRLEGRDSGSKPASVYLADTMGEMERFLALSDVAYIGKSSFGHVGGQSPIEALRFGVTTVMGAEYSNFKEMVEELRTQEIITVCAHESEVCHQLLRFMGCGNRRSQRAETITAWFEGHQGAYSRAIQMMQKVLYREKSRAQTFADAKHYSLS